MNRFWKNVCRRAGLLIAATALAALYAAQAQEIPELLEPVGVKMDTEAAYIGEMSEINVYDARVTPYTEGFAFEVDGEIDQIHVIIGQEVKAGDILISLDRESEEEREEYLRQEIEVLETNASYAKQIAEIDRRILELELQGLMSEIPANQTAIELKMLDIEQFDLNVAYENDLREKELQRMQNELDVLAEQSGRTVLTAPFDGTVMFLADIEQGSRVGAYAPLVYLADDSRLTIESAYISEVALEHAYRIFAYVEDGMCEIVPAEVDMSENIALMLLGEEIRTPFEIVSSEVELQAGMYVAVCLESNYQEGVLLVPRNALFGDSTGRYLYVVEDGQRTRRNVKVGKQNDLVAQIIEGLAEGEAVYVPD